MNARKYFLLFMLFLSALAWVGLMGVVGSVSGSLREEAALQSRGPFTDDPNMVAAITSVSRDNFKITLTVKLTDPTGKLIGGRGAGDFEVFESGMPAAASKFVAAGQAPIRMCMVIDYSNSMQGARITNAKNAALSLVDMLKDDHDHLGLYFFNGLLAKTKKLEVLPMGILNGERREAARQAITTTPLGGGTPMFNTMKAAFARMEEQSGRRVMVVMGDGADTDYRGDAEQIMQELADAASKQEVPVFVVGLEAKRNAKGKRQGIMESIALGVGGQYIDAQKPEELESIYKNIGATLQNEYVIDYESPNPVEDGSTRTVLLTVRQGDKGTKASTGYRVPGVTATGAARQPTQKSDAAAPSGGQPFWSILGTLGSLLGGLFAVPYLRSLRPRKTSSPAQTPKPVGAGEKPPTDRPAQPSRQTLKKRG